MLYRHLRVILDLVKGDEEGSGSAGVFLLLLLDVVTKVLWSRSCHILPTYCKRVSSCVGRRQGMW